MHKDELKITGIFTAWELSMLVFSILALLINHVLSFGVLVSFLILLPLVFMKPDKNSIGEL